jgi:exosortase B
MVAIRETANSVSTPWQEWLPVAAGLLALYIPTFYKLSNGLWLDDEYAHGPIILAVVIWLVWDKRQTLLTQPQNTARPLGFALLTFGLLLYVLGRSQGITILDVGSLAVIMVGTLLCMRGWKAVRTYWFMLLFIAYLLPLPGTFVDAITGPLKQNVSVIAEQILYAVGYPIARSGVVLTVGQYQLLVADACSGINSMFSLSAIGLLYLYLMQRKSWLHNGIILASLLPIAFCANILRVMFLVLVTYHFGDAAGQGFLHGFSGMVLFVVALTVILLVDAILSKLIKADFNGPLCLAREISYW